MRHVMSLVDDRPAPASLPLFARAAMAARSAWQGYRQRRRLKDTIITLEGLDDRTLKDIGLDRSEIESVVLTGGRDRLITRI